LIRPTNLLDIKSYSTDNTDYTYNATFTPTSPQDMDSTVFSNVSTYLKNWQTSALVGATFPWTELGYTYYWGHDTVTLDAIQGLSEFIILGNTAVKIIGIYSPQSYYYTKNKNGAFSSDSDAQYGNGFGSFNITANCDTIWAGNAFQANASTDASNPNQITIASGATISGGQGILVWSPNYTVTNSGTISGATSKKLLDTYAGAVGMDGTENVSLLFLGNTAYGNPGGKNILVNSGSIANDTTASSTAVEADAGDTEITNSGTISGYTYGVNLLTGTNSITNSGTISATGGAAGSAAIRIGAGTTTINNTGGTISGNVVLANSSTAALNVTNTELAVTGSYIQNSNSTLKITANSTTDYGKVTASGSSTAVASDSTLYITAAGYIPDNAVFSNVITGTGSTSISVPVLTGNSPIFTFGGDVGTGDHLTIGATRAYSYNSFAANSNSSAAGSVLNTLAMDNTATGDMLVILGQLDSLSSAGEINSALNSFTPLVDGGQVTVSNDQLNKFVGTAILRLQDSKIAEGPQQSEVVNPKNDIWLQVYGDYACQGKRGSSNGYRADLWGNVIGIDHLFAEDTLRLGLAQGFGLSRIRSKDNAGRTKIDNYQFGLYGEYEGKEKPYVVDAVLSYGYNDYHSSRGVNVGGINRNADSDYAGQQFSSYLEAGRKFKQKGLEIVPLVALNYTYLHLDGYTEKGADSLNLSVDPQSYNTLELGMGFRISRAFETKNNIWTPELHFRYFYNVINDKQQTTATFAGGGTSFQTTGYRPAPSSFNLGARLEFFNKKNITLLVDCDTTLKDNYYEAGGSLTFKYSF